MASRSTRWRDPRWRSAGSNSGTHNCGLLIQAANAVVRGLAIRGFGDVIGEGAVCVNGATNALIEGNVLGSGATSFVDPGATALRNEAGVFGGNSSSSTVQHNLIGFSRVTGVYLAAGATGWTVTGNEIRDSGLDSADGDGLTINSGTTNTTVGNLITGTSTQGIVVTAPGTTGNVFTNNTRHGQRRRNPIRPRAEFGNCLAVRRRLDRAGSQRHPRQLRSRRSGQSAARRARA